MHCFHVLQTCSLGLGCCLLGARLLQRATSSEAATADGMGDGRPDAGTRQAGDASADCSSGLRLSAESLITQGTGSDTSGGESREAPESAHWFQPAQTSQPTVFFSHNKSASVSPNQLRKQPANTAYDASSLRRFCFHCWASPPHPSSASEKRN